MGFDVGEPAHAVLIVASGGLEVGELLGPPMVEGVHAEFSQVFAGHAGQRGGHKVGFAFFPEMDDGLPAFVVSGCWFGQQIAAAGAIFTQDFESGLGERLEEKLGVMVAAALLIDADDQPQMAKVLVQVIQVGKRDGNEGGGFVVGLPDELVVAAFADHGGAQGEDLDMGLGKGGLQHGPGEAEIAGVAPVGEVGGGGGLIPGVIGEAVVGAAEVFDEGVEIEVCGVGCGEEGQNAAFEEAVAIAEVVDDFGIGDEQAAFAPFAGEVLLDDPLGQQGPEAGQVFDFGGYGGPRHL